MYVLALGPRREQSCGASDGVFCGSRLPCVNHNGFDAPYVQVGTSGAGSGCAREIRGGRSGIARICIVAIAIAIVSVGVASVYAAMRGEPWVYVSQHTGQ